MRIETLIQRLDDLARENALATMRAPSDKSEFGYGHAVGYYQGLLRGRAVIDELLREDDERNR